MLHLAAAGFQHETNSFAPNQTAYDAFVMADTWPGLTEGPALWDVLGGLNIPMGGFLDAARADPDVTVTPLLWAAAEPGGLVRKDAFDRVMDKMLGQLHAAGPIDGLYLDLHGAMIVEGTNSEVIDGESEILRRLRAVLGSDLPIVVSLDLHCKITQELADSAHQIAIFRTYPHLDMAATGARCLAPLKAQASGASRPACALRHGHYLVPMTAQWTGRAPAKDLYAAADKASSDAMSVEIGLGFPAGDSAATAPAVLSYAPDQPTADALADRFAAALAAAEPAFAADPPLRAEEAVAQAMATPAGHGPVVIADVADNPGGGGTADTMGLLHALIAAEAQGAVLGMVWAPDLAAQAHALGVGGRFEARFGASTAWPGDHPVQSPLRVRGLRSDPVSYVGEMYGGGTATTGPAALLQIDQPGCDIAMIVTSIPNQALDRGYFLHFGLDPQALRIIVLKSSVHYRADFEEIAASIIEADAPGRLPADLTTLPYRHLPTDLRRMPRGARHKT